MLVGVLALLTMVASVVASVVAPTAEARKRNRNRGTTTTVVVFDTLPRVSATRSPTSRAASVTSVAAAVTNRADPRLARIGFRSTQRLHDHFLKHGAEFGAITEVEYLRRAQALRDAPLGRNVLEATQQDGTISRFDRRTGAFMAFDNDLTIRTFFRPNDGEAYFRRAANRRR